MYVPRFFEVIDKQQIFDFIEANAFGQLVSSVAGRPCSTHMPFLVSADRAKLTGHFARQNPQHVEMDGQEVLVTLQGPHDYISPSWYSSPGVPTWNYQAVHIYGKCSVFDDSARLKEIVDALTDKYESGHPVPWQPEYSTSLLEAIVGIEIAVSEVQCKFKLSQNRSIEDRRQVVERLRSLGSIDLAEAMESQKR